jgi:hypothetical protein
MQVSHTQRLQRAAAELEAIMKELMTVAEVLDRENADSTDGRQLRLAADHVGNSLGRIAAVVPKRAAPAKLQSLGEMEAADPMVFSNQRCR